MSNLTVKCDELDVQYIFAESYHLYANRYQTRSIRVTRRWYFCSEIINKMKYCWYKFLSILFYSYSTIVVNITVKTEYHQRFKCDPAYCTDFSYRFWVRCICSFPSSDNACISFYWNFCIYRGCNTWITRINLVSKCNPAIFIALNITSPLLLGVPLSVDQTI